MQALAMLWLRQRVEFFLRHARTELDRNVCFWSTALIASAVFLTVPQVAHIWSQAQQEGMSALERLVFYGFQGVVILSYVASVITVLRPYPLRRLRGQTRRRWHKGRSRIVFLAVKALCWLPERACRVLPSARRRVWGVRLGEPNPRLAALALGVAVLSFLFGVAGDSSRLYPLAGVSCRNLGLVLLFAGAWLLAPSSTRTEHHIGPSVGRGISWLLLTTLAGEAIWLLGLYAPAPVSLRFYSIWAMCHIAAIVVLTALLVDRLHAMSRWPVRAVVAVLVIGGFLQFTAYPTRISRGEAAWLAGPGTRAAQRRAEEKSEDAGSWHRQLLDRVQAIPEGQGPVVIVAASGGGSRAAIFAALAFEALGRTPIDDKPICAGAPKGRTFGDNLVLISSVSGGSLAAAHHVVQRTRGKQLESVATPRNTSESELVTSCLQRLEKLIANLESEGEVAAWMQQVRYSGDPDPCRDAWRTKRAELEKGLEALRKQVKPGQPVARELRDALNEAESRIDEADQRLALFNAVSWLQKLRDRVPPGADDSGVDRIAWTLHSKALDAMSTDFMAPLFRGIASVVLGRDDALTRFWTDAFGWRGITNSRGYATKNGWEYPSTAPLVIYNASDVGKGRRLAVGFPPLPRQLWAVREPVDDQPWTRLGPIGFDAIAPGFELALARAVRMSSNFPWAFPVQEIVPAPNAPPVHVLDGGVVDNTGLDTVRHLLRSLEWQAKRTRGGPGDERVGAEARDILDALRKRGVLIFEIDSGAKPEEGFAHGMGAGILEPVGALNNAAYAQAERTKRDHLESAMRVIRGESQEQRPATRRAGEREIAFHFVLPCNHNDAGAERRADVMTAWSLGPKDKAEILTRFFAKIVEWDRSRKEIRGHLQGADREAAPDVQQRTNLRLERGLKFEQRAIGHEKVQGPKAAK